MSLERAASFSHREIEYLGLNLEEALESFKNLGLNGVRLSAYWSEVEKFPGEFDFFLLDQQIDFFRQNNIDIVLSVGMKAQRWPEYYFPDWEKKPTEGKITKGQHEKLLDDVLNFIDKVINRYKNNPSIKVWQVENEPLDKSGPNNLQIDKEFLREEVEFVRRIDSTRKVLINLWGNELINRRNYKTAAVLADIVGIDLYPKTPLTILGKTKYLGPLAPANLIRKVGQEIKSQGKEFWVVELQAEPWEENQDKKMADNPPSFKVEDFQKNLDYALSICPDTIIWWGLEYWLFKKQKGDERYINASKSVIT